MPSPVNQKHPETVDGVRERLGFWLRNDAARLLWPGHCLACDGPGEDGIDLCAPCLNALPRQCGACTRCALPLPDPGARAPHLDTGVAAPGPVCGHCLSTPPPLDEVHAACVYAAPLDRLLPRFKFHHDLAAGRLLAQLMAEAFVDLPHPPALLPIPLHRQRLRERGYDQALELARPLARALGIALLDDILVRRQATTPQSRLEAHQRQRNLRGAFTVRAGAAIPEHVVLVDDVMTTGATLHAAALALRGAGARRVDAWVAARVP